MYLKKEKKKMAGRIGQSHWTEGSRGKIMSPDNKPKIMTAQDLVSFGDLPAFLLLSS